MKKITLVFTLYCSLFSVHCSLAQTWLWGEEGIGFGFNQSVATDYYGNCYLSGYYYSIDTLDFSDSILINPPHNRIGLSMFLVKYNNIGNVLWAEQSVNYGNYQWFNGGTVVIDNSGNVIVNTAYKDTIILGSYMFIFPCTVNYDDYALAKYNSNGGLIWASSPTLNAYDTSSLFSDYNSTDKYGNVSVTGIFNADTIHFDSILMFGNRHIDLPFLVKYDSNGNVLWADAPIPPSSYIYNNGEGTCVATDRNANIYYTGGFSDTMRFGLFDLLSTYESGIFFLVKYSSNGAVLWAKQPYVPSSICSSIGIGLVTDQTGNIYLAGDFSDSIIIGTETLVSHNLYPDYQNSFFLAKYDSNGNVLWAKGCKALDSNSWYVGGEGSIGGGLSIDNNSHLYLSVGGGVHHCNVVFGNDTAKLFDTSRYDAASIIYKLDTSGNVLCSSIISGGGDFINSISSDTAGKYVYFGSTTATVMAFGSDTVSPFTYHNYLASENLSPFIARWDPCGEIVTVNNPPPQDKPEITVYPNPNNGLFQLELRNYESEMKCNIEIYNILGEKVFSEFSIVHSLLSIDISSQPDGIYLYRVLKEDGSLVGEGKLVVIHK